MEGVISTDMRLKWIQDWAFAPMPYYPEENWDIVISGPDVADALYDIIERRATPKDTACLSMLYLTSAMPPENGTRRQISRSHEMRHQ